MNIFKVRIIAKFLFFILLSFKITESQTVNNFIPVSYDLKFNIDYQEEKLSGKCSLTFKNEGENDTLPILLYRLLKVKSVTDNNGNPLRFSQRVVSFSDFEQLQLNYILINCGKSQTVIIDYEGYMLGYSETGMSYIKDNINPDFTIIRQDCFTYPIISGPSFSELRTSLDNEFDYTIEISVPDSLYAVNGGRMISREPNGNKTVFKYVNIKPAWRIDLCIAKYKVINSSGLTVYYFEDDSIGASMLLNSALSSYALFSDWFGEINNPGYSIIEIPDGWGSQTDVTCILQSAAAFKNINKMDEVYHEISHIWNVNSTDSIPCRVESEGLATFLQFLVKEKLTGNTGLVDSASGRILKKLKDNFSKNKDLMNIPMIDFGKKSMTNYSYTKGMLFFHLLYNISGDKAFFSYFKKYYKSFRETGGKIDDLMNIIIKDSGTSAVKMLVNEWIYTAKSSELIINAKDISSLIDYYKNYK